MLDPVDLSSKHSHKQSKVVINSSPCPLRIGPHGPKNAGSACAAYDDSLNFSQPTRQAWKREKHQGAEKEIFTPVSVTSAVYSRFVIYVE